MNKLKISLIALAVLGLSATAQARGGHDHGRGHAYGHGYGHGQDRGHDHALGRHRWQPVKAYQTVQLRPRCSAPQRVVYAPKRVVIERPAQIVIRPGVQVQIALGF